MPSLPSYSFERLITTVASGPWALITLALEILLTAWYLRAVSVLRARKGRRWPRHRIVCFAGGVASLLIAWQSGVPAYAGSVFTVHIVQHMALMLTGPILLGLAAPVTLAMQTLERPAKLRLLKVLRSRTWKIVSHPGPATVGNFGIMYWFFLGGGIAYVMPRAPLMDLVNTAFLVFGCLVWWPILSPDWIGRHRWPYPGRLALSLLGMPLDSFLVIALLPGGAQVSIAPKLYSIGSIHAGIVVFWIVAEMLTAGGTALVTLQWLQHERAIGRRSSGRLDRDGVATGGSAAAGWGPAAAVEPSGWVRVPWATGALVSLPEGRGRPGGAAPVGPGATVTGTGAT